MGEISQFRPGEKAPNNGIYIEIGETGSSVKDPQQIELHAGEHFPETSNKDRVWKNKRNINRPSTQ
ncbi:YjzC family protein [Ornithinibacillus contaminans]|uniref:YjzC family protein n=1 Tax=Ornithinibacillus contaminans TaxID=694055 RepID=UPI00064DB20B|nr:YjzC family protein [Ornithinibacillus contaminans]